MYGFNPELFVMNLFYSMDMENVVLIPSLDGLLTDYEAEDAGRMIRVVLNWDKDLCISEAREFGSLVERLYEADEPDEIYREYCTSGRVPTLLGYMIYKFMGFISLDAPEEVIAKTCEELAWIFVINRDSAKAERIDMLMDKRAEGSCFPECGDLTLDDFRRIAIYLKDPDHIMTRKAVIFNEMSATDDDVIKLYRDVRNS